MAVPKAHLRNYVLGKGWAIRWVYMWEPRLPGKQSRQLCKRLHNSSGIALFRKKRFFYHVKLQIINILFSS